MRCFACNIDMEMDHVEIDKETEKVKFFVFMCRSCKRTNRLTEEDVINNNSEEEYTNG